MIPTVALQAFVVLLAVLSAATMDVLSALLAAVLKIGPFSPLPMICPSNIWSPSHLPVSHASTCETSPLAMSQQSHRPNSINTTGGSLSKTWTGTVSLQPVVYDLVVVGAGVVGTTAALTAAQAPFLKRVALIDASMCDLYRESGDHDESIGVPKGLYGKLLRHRLQRTEGLLADGDSVWHDMAHFCHESTTTHARNVRKEICLAGVDIFEGFASFADPSGHPDSSAERIEIVVPGSGNVSSTTVTVHARHVLMATGSKPVRPASIPFDQPQVFDADSIHAISYLPKSLTIAGFGFVSIEYAKLFGDLGVVVTILVRDPTPSCALVKNGLDMDVADCLVNDLTKSGVKFVCGAEVRSVSVDVDESLQDTTSRSQLELTLGANRGASHTPAFAKITVLPCDAFLVAIGCQPNISRLNLGAVGIETMNGAILVDRHQRTSAPSNSVYAAGDVVGRPFLASIGVAQAKAAVHTMFHHSCTDSSEGLALDPLSQVAANPFTFPSVIWSNPEVGYYGHTIQQARERGIHAGEGKARYTDCLRGQMSSSSQSSESAFLKLVFHIDTGIVVGVHICGPDACELVHYGVALVQRQCTLFELSHVVFSAVTLHELYRIAAMAGLQAA